VQADRLKKLGAWLKKHGEAIYGTRICRERQHDALENGVDVFYTAKGTDRFAIVDGLPTGTHRVAIPVCPEPVTIKVSDEYPVAVKL